MSRKLPPFLQRMDSPVAETFRVRLLGAISRGMRGRCPRCGEGELFRRGLEAWKRCSECGLQFQRNQGDIWMFVIMMNRIPVMLGVAIVYFGFRAASLGTSLLFVILLAGPLLATVRHRQGIALALDYLSRLYFPDTSDELHRARALEQIARIRQSRLR